MTQFHRHVTRIFMLGMQNYRQVGRAIVWCLPAVLAMLLVGCGDGGVVGQQIKFGKGGDSERYRVSGWSHTEDNFTWTEGTSAKLSLPIGKEPGPLNLTVNMSGFAQPPQLTSQPVEVLVNGQKLADWEAGSIAREYSVSVPADAIKGGGTIEIEFRTPKATSPKSVGLNEDPRVLGIGVFALELSKV